MKHHIKLFFLLFATIFTSCNENSKNNASKDVGKTIAIQPFGKIKKSSLEAVRVSLKSAYQIEVEVLDSKELPKSAFINIKSPRYRADSLIRYLKRTKPDTIDYILGFTSQDISTTKKDSDGHIKKPKNRYQDWGIFGLGYRPGPSCVVSSFRIKNKNAQLTIERYKKICVHEIGHNLGLKHCPNKECVMTDACESIKTVDNVKLALCQKCKSKL